MNNIVIALNNNIDIFKSRLDEIIKAKTLLELNNNNELKNIEERKIILTPQEYEDAINSENASYNREKEALQTEQDDVNNKLDNLVKDPYKKIKDKDKKQKQRINSKKTKAVSERNKANREKFKKVTSNATKNIVPIIGLALSNQTNTLILQNQKLEQLVEQTNIVISNIQTQNDIINAKLLRDSTLGIITSQENKIQNINQTLNTIRNLLNIFNKALNVLSLIPIPVAVPPGIGLPMNVILKVGKLISSTQKIILSLNVLLAVVSVIIDSILNKLEELKNSLNNIGNILDNSLLENLSDKDISTFLNNLLTKVTEFADYKGYSFKIKEENDERFVVKGYKRHYAVAINKDGIEEFISDYSFTLDPQDLVDSLKLKINERINN